MKHILTKYNIVREREKREREREIALEDAHRSVRIVYFSMECNEPLSSSPILRARRDRINFSRSRNVKLKRRKEKQRGRERERQTTEVDVLLPRDKISPVMRFNWKIN